MTLVVDATEQQRKKKKTDRKKKRSKKKNGEVDEMEVVVVEEEVGIPEEEEKVIKKKEKKEKKPKKDKKKKKKEKKPKRDRESTGEADIEPPKKQAKVVVAANSFIGGLASVGDLSLAKSSPPIMKACYEEHPSVRELSVQEVAELRKKKDITLENLPNGTDIRPVPAFSSIAFPEEIKKITEKFTTPSPIQCQSWPILMSGYDMVGIAATGSGKTLAFGLPLIVHILAQPKSSKKGPSCLILSPTRELCAQIGEVLEEAGACCGVKSVTVYGGVPKHPQIAALKGGAHIVTATPGRLEDLMEGGHCDLSKASFLILDEADRMLDLGFLPHIRNIAQQIRSDRQTAMFSATWPQEVQGLAVDFMSNPVRCVIGSSSLSATTSVSQKVEVIDPKQKDSRLDALLRQYHSSRKNRIIVFVLYKKEADRVENFIKRKGFNCAGVHGDKSQADRTRAVNSFKAGTVPILIATDVAARGLDIPDVEYVVNYSFPLTTEDYVHRIGRTGRAGKTGHSHTFFTHLDKSRAGELQNVLRKAGQPIPDELMAFGSTVKKKESKLYGAHFKEVDMTVKATKILFDD
ncbi:hypothetical protein BSKO_11409 [Bryopsis sp. KO-2023]|nr:hypothetical protein BSKO_11409 [Bryopsis sp. KO-2023]